MTNFFIFLSLQNKKSQSDGKTSGSDKSPKSANHNNNNNNNNSTSNGNICGKHSSSSSSKTNWKVSKPCMPSIPPIPFQPKSCSHLTRQKAKIACQWWVGRLTTSSLCVLPAYRRLISTLSILTHFLFVFVTYFFRQSMHPQCVCKAWNASCELVQTMNVCHAATTTHSHVVDLAIRMEKAQQQKNSLQKSK